LLLELLSNLTVGGPVLAVSSSGSSGANRFRRPYADTVDDQMQ